MCAKRVVVIGAGPVGLACVKSLLEEGFEPVCFERTNHIGGLWRYHDDDVDGLASVMKTTIINSSKEMSAISDFPPKADAPNYMHNKQVHNYLTDYAEKFGVPKYVQFHKEVVEVKMADDYEDTGRLVVAVRDAKTQEVTQDTYDGVLVSIGHHVYPNMPTFPGTETFKGTIMHTHSLKSVNPFEDKVVVVVGVGNSGMDAAVEVSAVARQVYLSTRRGAWVLPRVGPWGLPLDIALGSRILDFMFHHLPYAFNCWITETMLNHRFDHEMYSLKPNHRVWSQHPTISDTLPVKLISGTVKVRKNIKKFEENGVLFEGEDEVTECDAVIFATGYKIKFPFLDDALTKVEHNIVDLYKYVFPPHLKHPTLAVIGLIQSVGAGFPIAEAQARWTTLLMKGKLKLPSKEEMEKDILQKREVNMTRYSQSERHTIQVDYIKYLDEINDLFGAKPNFLKIFFTDPNLFFTMIFGPSLPYQYRLQGPHSWPGARQAILDYKKRIVKPLKNDSDFKSDNNRFPMLMLIIVPLIMLLFCYLISFFI